MCQYYCLNLSLSDSQNGKDVIITRLLQGIQTACLSSNQDLFYCVEGLANIRGIHVRRTARDAGCSAI